MVVFLWSAIVRVVVALALRLCRTVVGAGSGSWVCGGAA